VRAFTLFATHYFELTTLATEVEGCANVHLDATEHGDAIVFLHAVKGGPADRSCGLQVARVSSRSGRRRSTPPSGAKRRRMACARSGEPSMLCANALRRICLASIDRLPCTARTRKRAFVRSSRFLMVMLAIRSS